MKALTQSSVAEEPRDRPGAVCPTGGKCPPNARCPIEAECPLEAEETARYVEEVEANRARLAASGGLSDADVLKLAVEYGFGNARTTLTPELRQQVEDHWCMPTVEYPPEEMARLDKIVEEMDAQIAAGEIVPQTVEEFFAELNAEIESERGTV